MDLINQASSLALIQDYSDSDDELDHDNEQDRKRKKDEDFLYKKENKKLKEYNEEEDMNMDCDLNLPSFNNSSEELKLGLIKLKSDISTKFDIIKKDLDQR